MVPSYRTPVTLCLVYFLFVCELQYHHHVTIDTPDIERTEIDQCAEGGGWDIPTGVVKKRNMLTI